MEQLMHSNQNDNIEISKDEYLKMKNKLVELENKINKIEDRDYCTKNLKYMVAELPIDHVRNSADDHPIFEYSTLGGDVWTIFLNLAKIIHRENRKFYMDDAGPTYYSRPYIRTTGKCLLPKVDSTDRYQKRISVEMLNELIPIYNKYYKMMHPQVLYRERGTDEYAYVDVLNNGKENK